VTVPGAGKVAVAAQRGGRKVASGKRTVSGGTASVKLRFTGQARRPDGCPGPKACGTMPERG
jgi:hypothetical protein